MQPHLAPRLDTFPQPGEESGGLAVLEPDVAEPGGTGSDFRVVLYNDEVHNMDEVVEQVMKATACDVEKAIYITLEAHRKGRAVCFKGDRAKCHEVARILREIRLQCEVDCD